MLLALTSTDEEGGGSTGAVLVEISMSNHSLTLWGQGVGYHLWSWVRATVVHLCSAEWKLSSSEGSFLVLEESAAPQWPDFAVALEAVLFSALPMIL